MTLRRQRKGVVLIIVLLLMLMLGILAASLLSSAQETEASAILAVSQRIAASRADQAAQMAIASIASGTISITAMVPCGGPDGLLNRAAPSGLSLCTAPNSMITSGVISGPPPTSTTGFEEGAGMQYQWWIYRQPIGPGVLPSQQLVRIYAEGYWGNAATSPNFTAASVEAEVLVPDGSGSAADSSDSFVYGG